MFMDSSSVLPDVTIYPPSLKLCCFPIRGSIGIHYMGIEPSVANVAQPAFRTYGLLLCAKFIHLAQQATNLATQTQAAATLQPSNFLPPPALVILAPPRRSTSLPRLLTANGVGGRKVGPCKEDSGGMSWPGGICVQ
jgi:hypothetical protein